MKIKYTIEVEFTSRTKINDKEVVKLVEREVQWNLTDMMSGYTFDVGDEAVDILRVKYPKEDSQYYSSHKDVPKLCRMVGRFKRAKILKVKVIE